MQKPAGDTGTIQRLVRADGACKAGGYRSPQQMYNAIADGKFPKPIKIGERAVAWVESELVEWQRKRIAERDARLAEKSKKKAAAQV